MSLKHMTVGSKIYLLVTIFVAAFVSYGVWSWRTLSIAKVNGPYYQNIVQGKDLIADILPPPNYIIESYLMALHIANETEDGVSASQMRAYVDRCKQLKTEYDQRHEFWLSDLTEGDIKRAKSVDSYEPAIAFYRTLESDFFPACLAGDADRANQLARGPLRESYETHRAAIDRVVELAVAKATQDEADVAAVVSSRMFWSIGISLGVLGSIAAFGWFIARETVSPLRGSADRLRYLSTHDLTEVSQQLRNDAESTRDQATMASGAAEQVSANAQSLATAVEQFEISIKEIAGNASNAATVARNAVDATDQTNATITRLGDSSAEIGNVIKVINSIAEQTNLLAL
ncbi:MAG: hypothetical protein AAF745_16945, partial [Planctomycetota bacterium]